MQVRVSNKLFSKTIFFVTLNFQVKIFNDFNYLNRRASPLLLDNPKYPPFGEKSKQLTFPILLDVVGKLENTVFDGTCN